MHARLNIYGNLDVHADTSYISLSTLADWWVLRVCTRRMALERWEEGAGTVFYWVASRCRSSRAL